jgi:hypothetical protein
MFVSPEAVFQTALAAAVTDWPIRWKNHAWQTTVVVSESDMPIDVGGAPLPAIEAEVIEGLSDATAGSAGNRHVQEFGLFRCYLSVAQGSGDAIIVAKARFIAAAFRRVNLYQSGGTRLYTMDPRIDGRTPGYEKGNLYCRMVSTPWILDYPN